MATGDKDFKIKNGLVVQGATATVNGENVLTTASSIDDLADVDIADIADGQALLYSDGTSSFVPGTPPSGPQGDPGDKGDKGDTGDTGPSGVISVTAPITNSGTSTSAVLGLDSSIPRLTATQTFTGTNSFTTAAVDTNSTQVATTAFVLGQASGSNPLALGTVAQGTSTRYARQDHVHPTTGLGLTSGTLGQFAATTSSQLAGVISDETGTGLLVFGTGPTLSQPIINNPRLGYTTTATAAGTTTLTATSSFQQFFTGTTTQTVVLPVTSTLALGQMFIIHNNSTGNVTVQSSGNNNIYVIPGGVTVKFTCILISGTTAASWDFDIDGAGSISGTGSIAFTNSPTFTGTVSGISKTMVGLGNVDNTSDANKPVSTATQTALNLKANLASPTFTGTPLSTTAAADTNNTQIATTAYVVGQAGTASPVMSSTASVGTSLRYARQDHRHPTDTSRASQVELDNQLTNFLASEHQPTGGIDNIGRGGVSFGSSSSVLGAIFFTYFTPLKNITVSEITMRTVAPAGSGITLARMGLYTIATNGDSTLVARTANDTTLFTSTNTTYTRSFDTTGGYPATYSLVAGTRYASAVIITGTSTANLVSSFSIGAVSALPPRISGARTSQTDLTTTNTADDIVNAAAAMWARLT